MNSERDSITSSVAHSRVLVSLYEGPDGPTIRVDVQYLADLEALMRCASAIGKGVHDEMPMEDIFPLTYLNIGTMVLGRRAGAGRGGKSVYVVNEGMEQRRILWSATADQWRENVLLMEGLSTSDQPCHQYMSDDIDDDAVVEIAYREVRLR